MHARRESLLRSRSLQRAIVLGLAGCLHTTHLTGSLMVLPAARSRGQK